MEGSDRDTSLWILSAVKYETGNSPAAVVFLAEIVSNRIPALAAPPVAGFNASKVDSLTIPSSPLDPNLPVRLFWLIGAALVGVGRMSDARWWLAEGAKKAPADPIFPRAMGLLELRERRYDEARQLFAGAREKGDPAGAQKGMALLEALRPGGSGPAGLAAAAETLGDAELFHQAGRLMERRKDEGGAAKAYVRATQLDPRFAPALTSVGLIFARRRMNEKALASLRRARDLGDHCDDLLQALSTLLVEAGAFEEAEPLLVELRERHASDTSVARNLAGIHTTLALCAANRENEEDAIERIQKAVAIQPEPLVAEAYRTLLAELHRRAAVRCLSGRNAQAIDEARDHLQRSLEFEPSSPQNRFALGLVGLASLTKSNPSGSSEPPDRSAMARSAVSDFAEAGDTPRTRIHQSIALLIAGDGDGAITLLQPLLHGADDPGIRLRARWVYALALAARGRPAEGRALLEQSEGEALAGGGLGGFSQLLGLQVLKLRAAEKGGAEIEREIASLAPAERTADRMLLFGIVLAGRKSFDEAEVALEQASRDPLLRSEAKSTRTLMQMSRIAELIRTERPAEAFRLLTRIRPVLPNDPEIDHWLSSLENEAVPIAAIRKGDGRPAVATWSSRVQGWKKTKDSGYFELVRSLAIAAHRTAISLERQKIRIDAERYWKIAIDRWLELLAAPVFWDDYAARARELFQSFEPEVLDEVRNELVQKYLVGGLGEVIGFLRANGEELVAAERYDVLDAIQSWRLRGEPNNLEIRRALASCHAQRLILFSNAGLWTEAVKFGEKACETDPTDPVHFNNLAEVYGSQAQPILSYINQEVERGFGGPHLRPRALQVVDLLSLALAWNPFHAPIRKIYNNVSPQVGYTGILPIDPRFQKAEKLRQMLLPGVLENYSGGAGQQAEPARQEIDPGVSPAQVAEMARKFKQRGIVDPETILSAIFVTYPALRNVPKDQILQTIVNA